MLAIPCLRISPFQINNFLLHSPVSLPIPCKQTERRETPEINQKNFFKIKSCQCGGSKSQIQISKFPPSTCPEADSRYCSLGQLLEPATIAYLLKSCSSLKGVQVVHSLSTKYFGTSITFVNNNLINAYARFFNLVDARKLFDQMPERSVVSWTIILNGYLNAGFEDEAFMLFEKLIKSNVSANSLTFVCLLKLCTKMSDFELGRQIHACVFKGNWRNLIVDSALLFFYAKCGHLSHASMLFDQMLVWDVICWTTMVSAYSQHGREDEALSLFSQMQSQGFRPNEFTICSILKACGELKALSFGKQLHGAIVKGIFTKDVFIESSLVGMYVKCKEISDARSVFNVMQKRNTITWTTMISGYAQNGFGVEAINLFKRMKKRSIFVNQLTIVSLIKACTSISSPFLGKEVHGWMVKSFSQSNTHIGSTLISFYCKCGLYDYAVRVLQTMPRRDCISWTATISGSASHGHGFEALRFLNNMLAEGLEPSPFTYSSALKACTKLESVNYGKWLHASANKTMTLPNVFVGSALIGMYMRCGYITDAFRVFDTMPERNMVSWKVMVLGYAKNGRCEEAMKLMYRMQAEGFHVDDFILTTVLSSCGDFVVKLDCSPSSFSLAV
ncbi:pentatricopeptide repeat-containing protein At4g18520, chloroplastic-like [Dendrobium catenatum]|uniref:Pentatricopeptide repeat-containing protein n=1 Tax=Dendrobium catenatum TaxID=906689 RepID=A0A2I0W732_9ASPA|nr:pentatricopeptide repeat-containing protein At4g18520, chloroplastic-like [Dendrobium catenatum]PKU71466.1 Pentatricopeptide repeat-containing protein [Dendrobium catenatum]